MLLSFRRWSSSARCCLSCSNFLSFSRSCLQNSWSNRSAMAWSLFCRFLRLILFLIVFMFEVIIDELAIEVGLSFVQRLAQVRRVVHHPGIGTLPALVHVD